MAKLHLKELRKSYGTVDVIKGIDLTIEDGEFCVFIGPSGCGKSTLLRMIAGLEDITGGTFEIDGSRMNDIAPAKRGVAMVFQSYALYPHLSVYENIAFGLKVRKTSASEIKTRVGEAVTMLQLEKLTERYPRELSGGQRQRVAIGRAIVGQPQTFLFDEPLSNLDAELRVHMRTQISELHQRLKRTMIYVTHDQVEAMTLADKIVLLRDGRIEQVGTPHDLYERPQNLFAAQFIGAPKMNIFKLTDECQNLRENLKLDRNAHYFGIRPDSFEIVQPGEGILSGKVRLNEYLGNACLIHADIEGHDPVILEQPVGTKITTGTTISLNAKADNVHAFAKDGNRIA
ncbi:ABC transporter ATP-binding protein [Thalassospira sp. MCCC 1A01428]|uniref:ABC transporter ATP-binding protein n=1 Tax=Thalassospira sp. MCCC 1A01428 TaxID=1470575 RepID=UPI000A1E0CED|nr:sn-glycerol-3-phosphate ABC transporter ATP-binding protein UgpC [Thalassospira sp. MCCC 1A01428]OSQ42503.1 ABC transporter ATP-binding protein [Thalassospira sp. MCCC 1A01428]